jgi:hypothetical protein
MLQTVEAIIDREGRVRLVEKVSITHTHRALVTILEEAENESGVTTLAPDNSASIVGSMELLTDDLDGARQEIVQIFDEALARSGEELNR